MKPQVFIASTSEGRVFAEAIVEGLKRIAKCMPWYEGVFEVGGNTQSSLLSKINVCDFMVVVMTADDTLRSRGKSFFSPRDNLIFEAGISFGSNSSGRTIIIPEQKPKFKLPSDLNGFTTTRPFDRTQPPRLAVENALADIKKAIRDRGVKGKTIKPFGKADVIRASRELIQSADRNIVLFGRDLSWADQYKEALIAASSRSVKIDIFCATPDGDASWLSNIATLQSCGADVRFMSNDLGLRLTLVDCHSEDVGRFMLISKKRRPMSQGAAQYIYNCEIHDAKESQILWITLNKLYDSIKILPVQS